MRRYVIPIVAFAIGSSLIAAIYFGILTWVQGWDAATNIFLSNRWYVIPIWVAFGFQATLYSILHFRLFVPTTSSGHSGAWIAASGGASVTAMIACCLHPVSGKPIFPVSANGKSILEGASKLTLTIVNVDVASRVFEWELK